jgi:hypothetical protein
MWVIPSAVTIIAGQNQQFTAIAFDQFGVAMAVQPTFTWSVLSGGGTISSGGLYSAPATSHGATIKAITGLLSASATIAIVPPAPSNLTGTVLSSISIKLFWRDASSNEDGFTIDASANGGAWTQIATLPANTTSYPVPGLFPATTYSFRVRAFNASGESGNTSLSRSLITTFIPVAPSNLKATAASTTQINLTWKDNSINEVGFKIERDDGTGWKQIAVTPANVTRYSNTGLIPGKSYFYRVRAYNSTGENSGYCDPISAATLPSAPQGLSAKALTGKQIQLAWTAVSGASGYVIERSLNGTTWSQVGSVGTTSFTNTGLTAGAKYYYRIRAYTSGGKGAYSITVSASAIA